MILDGGTHTISHSFFWSQGIEEQRIQTLKLKKIASRKNEEHTQRINTPKT